VFGKKLPAVRRIWTAYLRVGNFAKVRDILTLVLEGDPENTQLRLTLASMHLNLGNRSKAIEELQKIIKIQPDFKEQGEYLIKEIRAGRNP